MKKKVNKEIEHKIEKYRMSLKKNTSNNIHGMIIQNKIFTGIPDVKYIPPKLLLEDFKAKDVAEFSSNKIVHENSSKVPIENKPKNIIFGFQRDLSKSSNGDISASENSKIELTSVQSDSRF